MSEIKRGPTVVLFFVLLISAVAGAISINLATANPGPLLFFPTEPVTTQPTIIVNSPVQNQTYNSTDVWLNFTIIKPETWFAFNIGAFENGTRISNTFGNITSVYYTVDGNERQNITVHDNTYLVDLVSPTRTLNFSTKLALTPEVHTIKITIEADSYYVVNYYGSEPFSSVKVYGNSEPVRFTVHDESFPTVLIAVLAAVALLSAGLLVYFKKRKRKGYS